ncbi:DeoR/GlpR family DNA-binding transcription regulator [Streptomyces sp. XD-27]|uniref:DeoR/GlpR family DNA-binding transcription regulator n=1 Tax=Streptomyces sp. XD-27 TaxID=3062779 RepID=UPI0026F476BF|nr:DeoR/GlpR family DNA-binding transcription regulator [Streptomyces sp. XD-27]WKX73295.1 DeoR/GlpR family DNA-binding transcription regulator [Streptomyces sp. XD-27]
MRPSRGTEEEVEQRRRRLLQHVITEGAVRIDALAESLEVSTMTVHRDLANLESRQLLHKRRGMAVALPNVTLETATRFREYLDIEVKEAFAEVLAREVEPGQTVLMDCGSTLFPLARKLTRIADLTVVTNSLRVAGLVGGADAAPGTRVVLLGGTFRNDFEACAGTDTLRQLSRIRANVMFSSATALQGGRLYHPDQEWADLKEAMQGAAERRVLPVDHTKFGRTATYGYGDATGYDLIVTDAAAPEAEVTAIEALGVPVELVTV